MNYKWAISTGLGGKYMLGRHNFFYRKHEKSLAASGAVPSGSSICRVDWPRTATGKVDRKAWTPGH